MEEIYLDNAATTRTHRDAAIAAVQAMIKDYGNPSSLHIKGFNAQQSMDKARQQIAKALGSLPEELFFTSGGTEANNLALLGGAAAGKRQGKKIVTCQIEHSSVLEPLRYLAREEGYTITEIPPTKEGQLDLEALIDAVDEETILVSCMMVNSEIGTISPIAEAAARIKRKNPKTLFHSDAVQGFGKIPFSVSRLGVDLLTISGHKIYAPKGIGALYIRKGVRILPGVFGGGQEREIRPGTENMPGICAFGVAGEMASRNLNENFAQVRGLCKYFINKAEKTLGLRMNTMGDGTPYICNLSVPGYPSEVLLHYLEERGIYVSSGSACSRGKRSHVLSALGLSNQRVDSALRISFSAYNTTKEIDEFFRVLQQGREELIRS